MRRLKRVALASLVSLVVSLGGGYVYFDRKFTPPENALSVSSMATEVPIRWLATNGNPHAALLLPVKLDGIADTFYMQLDLGSPSTVFYGNAIRSVLEQRRAGFAIGHGARQLGLGFSIDGLRIRSGSFGLLDYGSKVEFGNPAAANIIGTIGTDLLEKRILVLDFKRGTTAFLQEVPEAGFSGFKFTKRRVLIPARIAGRDGMFLYDSGSSGYALLTSKQEWDRLRTPGGAIKVDTGNSWGRALKVMTAPAAQTLALSNATLRLSEVTYVEGTSRMQEWLMRSSGMQGMLGNKLFLGHTLTLDAKRERFKLE